MENKKNYFKNETSKEMPNSYLNAFQKRIYSTILQSEGTTPNDWLYFFIKTLEKINSEIRISSVEHLKKLNLSNLKNKEEFSKFISKELFDFYNKNYTIEQIKNFSHEDQKEFGFLEVNEVLTYDLNKEKTEIKIHIPIIPTDNILDDTSILIDGFKKLAEKIKSEKEFLAVEKITGYSWLVYYHKKFIEEKLGFTIESVDEKLKKAKAYISKEKFLEIYGNNL